MQKLFFPEEWIAIDMRLSKMELLTLFIIDRRGEIIMSTLSDFLHVPMSTSTGIVDRLVRNSYVRRERSENDRRIVTLSLTEQGNSAVSGIKETLTGYLSRITEALSREEQRQLTALISKLVEALSSVPEGSEAAPEHDKAEVILRTINVE